MSSSSGTIYLISGANRDIGLALVAHILEIHDSVFIYAGARNPSNASDLKALERSKYPGKLSIVKCVAADPEGNAALAEEIKQRHGHVDTFIANAAQPLNCHLWIGNNAPSEQYLVNIVGIATSFSPVSETTFQGLQDHFHVNLFGTIILFQSVFHLLKKSSNPRFIPVSSAAGRLDGPLVKTSSGYVSYGSSKAALNWATRKIHFENEWLVAFPLNPGVVETDMLNHGSTQDETGLVDNLIEGGFAISAATAAAASIRIIDQSTRRRKAGNLLTLME